MKFKGVILLVFLALILMTCITAISAENATDVPLAAEDTEILEDSNGTGEVNTNEDATDTNEDNDTVIFTEYKNKDKSQKIVVKAKAKTNKGKVGGKILYTVKVTNNNLFDVYLLDLYMGEREEYSHLPIGHKGFGIYDDEWITVYKLGAGETKTIKMYLKLWEPGNTTIKTLVGPFESKSKIRTIANTPKVTGKTVKTKITYKANGKAVKKLKVKVKVYTGKHYKVFKLKTNKKGIIKFKAKKIRKGKHKIVLKSMDKKYSLKKTFKIRI